MMLAIFLLFLFLLSKKSDINKFFFPHDSCPFVLVMLKIMQSVFLKVIHNPDDVEFPLFLFPFYLMQLNCNYYLTLEVTKMLRREWLSLFDEKMNGIIIFDVNEDNK